MSKTGSRWGSLEHRYERAGTRGVSKKVNGCAGKALASKARGWVRGGVAQSNGSEIRPSFCSRCQAHTVLKMPPASTERGHPALDISCGMFCSRPLQLASSTHQ